MIDAAMPKTEADYEAESDARTLAKAESIRGNPKRLDRAILAARRLAEEQEQEYRALQSVAGGKPRQLTRSEAMRKIKET